ncbi:MTH538 TIR-like domain (DUF1863) [Pseudomonas aeruginosa]|nr:MTH538 TIR-like domain (DUF1863) [Pseudomonas aeruginosa]
MARKVFYSFHYQRDSWRASKIRNIGVVEGNQPASDNKWEEVKRGGEAAIKRWIDDQLQGRTCTIVLVGAETRIAGGFGMKLSSHGMLERALGDTSPQATGPQPATISCRVNPFDSFNLNDGRKLSTVVRIYDPPGATSSAAYNHISDNLSGWIEAAIAAR